MNCDYLIRYIVIILTVTIVNGGDTENLEHFVERYFLLAKSKMESSPTFGQDIKEGYDRFLGVFKSELVLDSLDSRRISHYQAGIRHFKNMENIRVEVSSGTEFRLHLEKPRRPNFNVNYFSSSID